MFSDLSLSGISAFASGETGGLPTFDYGNQGGNVTMAQTTYSDCINAGGNSTECGAKAWVSGLTGDSSPKIVSTKSNGFLQDWKDNMSAFLGVYTHGAVGGPSASKLMGITPTRIVAGIIGIILIIAALFLLRSPIQIIGDMARGD